MKATIGSDQQHPKYFSVGIHFNKLTCWHDIPISKYKTHRSAFIRHAPLQPCSQLSSWKNQTEFCFPISFAQCHSEPFRCTHCIYKVLQGTSNIARTLYCLEFLSEMCFLRRKNRYLQKSKC